MKKLLIAVSICLFSLTSNAQLVQVNKPVVCGKLKDIIEEVSGEKYQEQPFWTGAQGDTNKIIIMLNKKEKTWTIIQYEGEIGCMIGSGNRGALIFPNSKDL